MSERLGVIFAGGGSGGHLFPGIAVAERLPESARAVFVCSDRRIDRDILEREARDRRASPAAPLSVRPLKLYRFVTRWGSAVRFGRDVIRELRDEDRRVVVVSVGGFVAAPTVQAARGERVPILMLNLDVVPGKANRWIARHATRIATTAEVGPASWERVSPLVRTRALAPADPGECRVMLGLERDRPTLLVTGASQGAGSINRLMEAYVDREHAALVGGGWQVLHQAGASAPIADLQSAYERAGVPARVVEFIEEMGVAWGAADVAVARAAAGTVGEAIVNRVPTVFLPYPFHKDQHQKLNAQPLIDAGAARMVTDRVQAAETMSEFADVLTGLVSDGAVREALCKALASMTGSSQPGDGPTRVVKIIEEIASIGD